MLEATQRSDEKQRFINTVHQNRNAMEKEDLLDKYIRDELSDEEKAQLEGLENSQEDLDFLKDMQTVLQVKERENLKAQFQSFEADGATKVVPLSPKVKQVSSKKPPIWGIAIAASFAVLITAALWLFTSNQTDYFAANFKPYPNIVAPTERGATAKDALTEAMQTYERGQYATALSLLEQLPNQSDTTQFFSAISALVINQDEKAVNLLNQVSNAEGRFQQEANWYLALTYLKLEDEAKAKAILTAIRTANDHPYQRDAVELLNALQ